MIDGHIHIERGAYTLDWINQFVSKAVEMEIDEIRLLEHCYRFEEFAPMYDSVCAYSEYVNAWFHRNSSVHKLADYLELINDVDEIYRRYFEDSISLAKSRIFDGIGHPDAIKLFGHNPSSNIHLI